MDLRKPTNININIDDFWMSVSNYPYKCGYPHWYPSRDNHARTFCNGYLLKSNYPWMDVHVFMDINLQLSMLLWIPLWIFLYLHGYPWMGLLWILDPGTGFQIIGSFFREDNPSSWRSHFIFCDWLALISAKASCKPYKTLKAR